MRNRTMMDKVTPCCGLDPEEVRQECSSGYGERIVTQAWTELMCPDCGQVWGEDDLLGVDEELAA